MWCSPTKADGLWFGFLLLALSALGFLHVAGVVDAGHAISLWWPVAIIGWAVTGMIAARRVTVFGIVVAGFGFGLLADAQHLAVGPLAWSALFAFAGGALVVSLLAGSGRARHSGDKPRAGPAATR